MALKTPTMREASILSVLLQGELYGLEVRNRVKEQCGDEVPLGSLYVTLERMEAAGFLQSRMDDESADRAGNRRRYFNVTARGRQAITDFQARVERVTGGLRHA